MARFSAYNQTTGTGTHLLLEVVPPPTITSTRWAPDADVPKEKKNREMVDPAITYLDQVVAHRAIPVRNLIRRRGRESRLRISGPDAESVALLQSRSSDIEARSSAHFSLRSGAPCDLEWIVSATHRKSSLQGVTTRSDHIAWEPLLQASTSFHRRPLILGRASHRMDPLVRLGTYS
jgi:hypothetical protein